jgi:hypothetical protein
LEGSKDTFLDQQPFGAAKMLSKRSAECCFKFPMANSPDVDEPKRKFITMLLTGDASNKNKKARHRYWDPSLSPENSTNFL